MAVPPHRTLPAELERAAASHVITSAVGVELAGEGAARGGAPLPLPAGLHVGLPEEFVVADVAFSEVM